MHISHAKRKKMDPKCKPKQFFIKVYDYSVWSKSEEDSIH